MLKKIVDWMSEPATVFDVFMMLVGYSIGQSLADALDSRKARS